MLRSLFEEVHYVETPRYRYRPLAEGHFRLLELRPGNNWQPLAARLTETDLKTRQPYIALSYVWGTTPPTTTIILDDDFSLLIRPNLYNALRALRDQNTFVVLWIDALCINQDDIEERSSQVRSMTKIYENAAQVVAWLGEETDTTKEDMHLIRRCDNRLKDAALDPILQDVKTLIVDRTVAGSLFFGFFLTSILSSPWFHRVWILQESAVNQNFVLRCGRKTIELESIVRAIMSYQVAFQRTGAADAQTSNEEVPPLQLVLNIYTLRRRILFAKMTPKMDELLRFSRFSQATDPRDHIFALLGIAKHAIHLKITPDYNVPWAHVHVRAARALLVNRGLLSLLSYKGLSVAPLRSPYPSWVPEWYDPGRLASFTCKSFDSMRLHGKPLYEAGGKAISGQATLRGGLTLHLRGKIIDVVASFEEGVREQPFSTRDIGAAIGNTEQGGFQKWVLACAEIAKQCNPYPASGGASNALLRTLVADATPDLRRAPSEYVRSLTDWIYVSSLPAVTVPLRQGIAAFHEFTDNLGLERKVFEEFHDMEPLRDWIHEDLEANISDFTKLLEDTLAGEQTKTNDIVALISACQGRLFGATSKKYVCLLPHNAELGDTICVLPGVCAPLVLRRQQFSFRIIGDCYVHGIMDGEVMNMPDITMTDIIVE